MAAEVIFCFLFLSLFVGALVSYLLSRYFPSIPYTVIIFALGIAISALINHASKDILKTSMEMWNNIEPDLILYAFLPALLFGEAMSLNWQHVKATISSAILLAGPGAIFGTFAVAFLVHFALPYNWSWDVALVFGAVLCATDPVAVVALMKKAGASSRLTYCIIGEALLNDGAALVLYNLLFGLLVRNAAPVTVELVAVYFVKVIIISPLLGIAMGLVALYCIGMANNRLSEDDTSIQMAITLCCAYLTFFVAEYQVGVSGVICCCAAAVTLARYAPPLILHPESLHSIWAAIEWVGNTLIFMLAGLLIGFRSAPFIDPKDIGYSIIVYIFVTVVRIAMVVIFYPVISRTGAKLNFNESLFLTWSGLRGAVSMALALSLSHQIAKGNTYLDQIVGERIFFMVGGVATITLLVNATLAGIIMKKLNLTEGAGSDEVRVMERYLKKRIRARTFELVQHLMKTEPYFDIQVAAQFCTVVREGLEHPESFDSNDSQGSDVADATEARVGQEVCFSLDDLDQRLDMHHSTSREDSFQTGSLNTSMSTSIHNDSFNASIHSERDQHRRRTNIEKIVSSNANSVKATIPSHVVAQHNSFNSKYLPVKNNNLANGNDNAEQFWHESEDDTREGLNDSGGSNNPLISDAIDVVNASISGSNRRSSLEEVTSPVLAPNHSLSPVNMLRNIKATLDDTLNHSRHSKTGRGERIATEMQPSRVLLMHMRRTFLEVVRVKYWQLINTGKLQRTGKVTLLLLNSIDVALEQPNLNQLGDWKVLLSTSSSLRRLVTINNRELNGIVRLNFADRFRDYAVDSTAIPIPNRRGDDHESKDSYALDGIESGQTFASLPRRNSHKHDYTDQSSCHAMLQSWHDALQTMEDSQRVYLLTNFIEAHQHAQRKIPHFLGEKETMIDTPEEAVVVQESIMIVNQAKKVLQLLNERTIRLQVSKQASSLLLYQQERIIEDFIRQGIIAEKDAENLLHEVIHDTQLLDYNNSPGLKKTLLYIVVSTLKLVGYRFR